MTNLTQPKIILIRQIIYIILGALVFYGILIHSLPIAPSLSERVSIPLSTAGIKTPHSKVLFILIDGFSYRFLNRTTPKSDRSINGRFPLFQKILEREPNNTFFAPCITGAPTWTPNGVKTIATGSSPGYPILSFLKEEPEFETWFDGVNSTQRNFMYGDEIWDSYTKPFKDRFTGIELKRPYSIVDTIDHFVFNRIFERMRKNDWDNIFAHVTDFDSYVHAFNLHGEKTKIPIEYTLEYMEKVMAQVDDNTTVIITSDHGEKETGHGGFSYEEMLSFLFVYNKNGLLGNNSYIPSRDFLKDPVTTYDIANIMSYFLGNSPPLNSIGSFPPQLQISNVLDNIEAQIKNLLVLKRLEATQQQRLLDGLDIEKDEANILLDKRIEDGFAQLESDGVTMQLSASLFEALNNSNAEARRLYMSLSQKFLIQPYFLYLASLVLHLASLFAVFTTTNILKMHILNIFSTAAFMGGSGLIGMVIAQEAYSGLVCGLYSGLFLANIYELGGGNISFTKSLYALSFLLKKDQLFLPATLGLIILSASSYWSFLYTRLFYQMHSYFFAFTMLLSKIGWSTLFKQLLVLLVSGGLDYIRLKTNIMNMPSWISVLTTPNSWITNLIPGVFLYFVILNSLNDKYKFKEREFALSLRFFKANYITTWIYFACMYHDIGGYQLIVFFPWINLIITFIGLVIMIFKERPSSTSTMLIQLILMFTPILAIFGRYNSFGVLLFLFYSIVIISDKTNAISKTERFYSMAVFTLVAFYLSGNSNDQLDICLNCGALFLDTYHALSGVILLLKMIYPLLLGMLFALVHEIDRTIPEMGFFCLYPMIFMITPMIGLTGLFFKDHQHFTEFLSLGHFSPSSLAWFGGSALASLISGGVAIMLERDQRNSEIN